MNLCEAANLAYSACLEHTHTQAAAEATTGAPRVITAAEKFEIADLHNSTPTSTPTPRTTQTSPLPPHKLPCGVATPRLILASNVPGNAWRREHYPLRADTRDCRKQTTRNTDDRTRTQIQLTTPARAPPHRRQDAAARHRQRTKTAAKDDDVYTELTTAARKTLRRRRRTPAPHASVPTLEPRRAQALARGGGATPAPRALLSVSYTQNNKRVNTRNAERWLGRSKPCSQVYGVSSPHLTTYLFSLI